MTKWMAATALLLSGCASFAEIAGPSEQAASDMLRALGYTKVAVGAGSDCYAAIGLARKFQARAPVTGTPVTGKVCATTTLPGSSLYIVLDQPG